MKRKIQKESKKPNGNLTDAGKPRGTANIPGKNLIDPSKEWPMDEADVQQGIKYNQYNMVAGSNMMKLAQLRRNFVIQENDLLNKLDMIEKDQNDIVKAIKEKHKIIADIDGFDIKRNKIVTK